MVVLLLIAFIFFSLLVGCWLFSVVVLCRVWIVVEYIPFNLTSGQWLIVSFQSTRDTIVVFAVLLVAWVVVVVVVVVVSVWLLFWFVRRLDFVVESEL